MKKTTLLLLLFIAGFICGELFTFNLGEGDRSIMGFLKGNDYVYFYNGGKLITQGSIYQGTEFQRHLQTDYNTVADQREFRPLHPPLIFYLYVPLTWLRYLTSVNVGTVFFYLVYLSALFIMALTDPVLKKNKAFFFFTGLCFPPLTSAIQTGHPSALWLLFTAGAYYFWKQGRPFIGGLILSLLLMKPNYFLLAGAVFVIALDFKVAAGMLCGGAMLVFITGIWDGFSLWKEWVPVFFSYQEFLRNDGGFDRQHSTKTFLQFIYNHGAIGQILSTTGTIIGAAALIIPGIYKLRSKTAFSTERFWFMVPIALVLANPHVYDYDLVLLTLPLALIVRKLYLSGINTFRQLVGLGGIIILLAFLLKLSPVIHIQITVPFFWFLLLISAFGSAQSLDSMIRLFKKIPEKICRSKG